MLQDIVDTGAYIDARIDQRLIENIFFKNSPLHDGAMVISKNVLKLLVVFFQLATIKIFQRNLDYAIVPH